MKTEGSFTEKINERVNTYTKAQMNGIVFVLVISGDITKHTQWEIVTLLLQM